MQTHLHDSMYIDVCSVPTGPTPIKGGATAAAESAVALQAKILGRRHDVDTDRQTCAEMSRHYKCSLHGCKTVYVCDRQSAHVQDSPHMFKTVYTCGRQSTQVGDSLQLSFDERQAHKWSDEAPSQF